MTLTRIPTWRTALHEAIEARRRQPFAWGSHDCATFAADCVLAMTGADLIAAFRGRYDSALGAARVLAEAGHADLGAAVSARLEIVSPLRARVGDLAGIRRDGALALGVVAGAQVLVLTEAGLGSLPRTAAQCAWRVG